MPHIGNDIVDLHLPENREKIRDRRFLDRVFTAEERAFIEQRPEDGHALLWALWAGKESAYKALGKNMPDISSAPRRYRVVFSVLAPDGNNGSDGHVQKIRSDKDSIWTGTVETPAGNVSCQALLTPDYAHCLAVAGGCLPDERIVSHILKWKQPENPSAALRRSAIIHMAGAAAVDPSAVEIIRYQTPKGLGMPCVLINGRRCATDITLSHDGRWGAFALLNKFSN